MVTQGFIKQIFFIYPHHSIQEKMFPELINREFEIYQIRDHRQIESICEHYANPIIFINIDEGLKETEWDYLIHSLNRNDKTKHSQWGILSFNDTEKLVNKYLNEIKVTFGFHNMKMGIKENTKNIIKLLESDRVRGNRKFIRARCDTFEAQFNVPIFDDLKKGRIIDISSAGMTVHFNSPVDLKKNSLLPNIQLKLKGVLVNTNAVVLGYREIAGDPLLYILMFDNQMPILNKAKIRKFIHTTLQKDLSKKMNRQYA